MEPVGFVPLFLPFKPTRSDLSTGAAGENQIPGSFFLGWVLKKIERERKSLATSPASSLPNSGEEAGLARERRRRGGNYFLSLPPQPLWQRPAGCENITLRGAGAASP